MYTQPMLIIPPEIELGLLSGSLRLFGGTVREADTGRIVKHLKTAAPTSKQVEQAVRKLNPRVAVPVVAVTVAVGGAATYLLRKRTKAAAGVETTVQPECVTAFESSLRDYVEAGKTGALTTPIIDQFISDVDVLQAFSESGNDVTISLDKLMPLLDLVIAHTPRLAAAYDAALDNLDDHEGDGVVVSLRRHLEAQKAILENAA